MSYSPEILNAITSFLDSDDWKYTVDTDREVIKSGLSLKNKLKHVDIFFDLRDDKYLLYFVCPLNCGEAERPEMRSLLNRINYGIMFGNFEMDERDGEIRMRYAVDCDGQIPNPKIIRHSIYRSVLTIDKYGDAIVQVLMGFGSGEEVYNKVNTD